MSIRKAKDNETPLAFNAIKDQKAIGPDRKMAALLLNQDVLQRLTRELDSPSPGKPGGMELDENDPQYMNAEGSEPGSIRERRNPDSKITAKRLGLEIALRSWRTATRA
jgi:hypothetical protein